MRASERRSHEELAGQAETGAQVRLGSGVRLAVRAGAGGEWLVESASRLVPGSVLEVLAGTGARKRAVRAIVARSEVIAIDRQHGPRYRARLVRLVGEGDPPGSTVYPDGNELPVRHEHAIPISPK